MNRKLLLSCLLLAGFALPVLGHHSFSMFDDKKEVVLKGEVKEFQWSNPHTWIQLNVTDASGKVGVVDRGKSNSRVPGPEAHTPAR
jgi:hypothetical protein